MTTIDSQNLERLRLPELQALYAEVTGTSTKAPNKKFLIRKIREGLEAQAAEIIAEVQALETMQAEPASVDASPEQDAEAEQDAELTQHAGAAQDADAAADGSAGGETPLRKLSVPELQARYLEVVGRPTGSSHRRYLIWKIREAQKGRVPVGPRNRRNPGEPAPDYKILPFRMEADLVERLDEARERLALRSRMDLFRKALASYLGKRGEAELAAALDAQP